MNYLAKYISRPFWSALFYTLFNKNRSILPIVVLILVSACKKNEVLDELGSKTDDAGSKTIQLTVPKGFPYPEIPLDNLPTQNRIDLGKKLFFDPILSRDSTISCASCHHTDKFFTDNQKLSKGIDGRLGKRNATSLINVAYLTDIFWDGGVPNLEQQVLAPIEDHTEMDFDANKVVERLKKHSNYSILFQKAYQQEPTIFALTRAIACYERTLIGGTSRFDRFLNENDSSALSESEIRGHNLFLSEDGECFHCHVGFNFTDNSFRNNGLYRTYPDSGRARITMDDADIGKFKVPSLRNITKTAPYMHDGSLATLDQVLDHYISGGKRHPNRSPIIKPLPLNLKQKQDIINFLSSLTDE
ncbi:MAG: cytochrome-c peroxidase [Cytophagales bacterium]